jgi:hypothetical protein
MKNYNKNKTVQSIGTNVYSGTWHVQQISKTIQSPQPLFIAATLWWYSSPPDLAIKPTQDSIQEVVLGYISNSLVKSEKVSCFNLSPQHHLHSYERMQVNNMVIATYYFPMTEFSPCSLLLLKFYYPLYVASI